MARPLRKLPKIKHPGTAEALIAVASSQIGYQESSNNDTFFGRWYGMNNAPWCAIFLSWAAFVSGNKKNIPKHAYTPSGAAWFKKRDRWGKKPRVGAFAYYDTAGLGRISHVGVVDKVFPDGSWTSVEGNTNSAGSREGRVVRRQKRRTVGPNGGFAYPKYKKVPKPVPKVVEAPKPNPPKPAPSRRKTTLELAREVIDGKWGTGNERKKRLAAAGYSYREVQAKVNQLLR